MKESILVQIPLADVNRLLRSVSKGNTLTTEVDKEKYNVLFKEIARDPVSHKVEHIEFQHLVADEAVNSVIKVALMNREKNQNLIQQLVLEIPYVGLSKAFLQHVAIPVAGMQAAPSVKVH